MHVRAYIVKKTCLQIWNSVLGQLCPFFILNVYRPVFLIVIRRNNAK